MAGLPITRLLEPGVVEGLLRGNPLTWVQAQHPLQAGRRGGKMPMDPPVRTHLAGCWPATKRSTPPQQKKNQGAGAMPSR